MIRCLFFLFATMMHAQVILQPVYVNTSSPLTADCVPQYSVNDGIFNCVALGSTISLSGDVTGSANSNSVVTVGGKSASAVAAAVDAIGVPTHLNTANQIVKRDALGNFSANAITASLNGNAATATTAGTASRLLVFPIGCPSGQSASGVSEYGDAYGCRDTSNAANITTGTIDAARLPAITSIPASATMPNSGGDTAADWADYISLLKTSVPIAAGGTGATTAAAALSNLGGIAASVLTTRGDLLYRGASAPERLPKGSTGALLFAGANDPAWTSTSGIVWDSVNGRLGIGTATPTAALTIVGGAIQLGADGSSVQMYVPNGGAWRSGTVGSFSYFDLGNVVVRNGNGATSAASLRVAGGIAIGSGYTGTAPPTDGAIISGSVGIGAGNTAPSGTLSVFDNGSTSLNVRAGAGQGSTALQNWQDNAGNVLMRMRGDGVFQFNQGAQFEFYTGAFANNTVRYDGTATWRYGNGQTIGWSSTTAATGSLDLGIARSLAGRLEVNDGTAGNFRDIRVRDLITTIATPASASAACTAGTWEGDANYLYFCTASGAWKRVAISTW